MKRMHAYLVLGAALSVLTLAWPGTADAGQTTTKFCINIDNWSTDGNTIFCSGHDDWLKIKFKVESCGGCGRTQVEEIHKRNSDDQRTSYKCGGADGNTSRTYTTPTGNAQYTGKIDLRYGPDKYFDATKGGVVCVTGETKDDGCNPWRIKNISYSGC